MTTLFIINNYFGICDKQISDYLKIGINPLVDNSQGYFSNISNVRVAWGGMDAVESVMNTKKNYGTEDVIFGPKKSFAVIEKE